MATINGQPSIFKSVETPTENIPTYETRIADFVVTAKEMATDAELKARAKTEAEKHTLCPKCQAGDGQLETCESQRDKSGCRIRTLRNLVELPALFRGLCPMERSSGCRMAERPRSPTQI